MEVYGVIYLLINNLNDKEYVGQTTRTVEERFREHAKCKATYIGKAIRAHGKKNFTITILKVCESKEELDYWEKHFIKSRNTVIPNGYNLTEGGENSSMSCDESRAKVSVAKRRNDSPFKNLIGEMSNKNLTFRGLAKLLGLSHQALSAKIYTKQNFTKEQVDKLIEIFEKPTEYLLERDDGKNYLKPSTVHRAYSPYKNLLKEIESRQILYSKLATNLKISVHSLSRKMKGKYNFTAKDIAKLVEIFDKPAEYLMARDD